MRIKREWIDSSSGENLLPNLEYWLKINKPTYLSYLKHRNRTEQAFNKEKVYSQYVKELEVLKASYTTGYYSGIFKRALENARIQKTSPQVARFFESKVIIDDEDEQSIVEEISNLSILETETPGESSEKNREIEDDQMVADLSLQDLFGSEFHCSDNMMSICQYHNEICPNDPLIDLRPNSNFTKQLPSNILAIYLKDLDDRINSLIPSNIHDFLTKFFKQNLADGDWNDKIDDLQCSDKTDHLMVSTIRILRRTLPIFIMAFSLGPNNPLLNLAALERPHLNAFVHPCLQASLWYISSIIYEFGEITTKNHKREYADGVGYLNNADKYQLVYMEGSRPYARDDKEIADALKISKNLQKIFINVFKDSAKCRRRLPKNLAIFGGQSFRLRIHLQFMDYLDNANLPRDFTEMKEFVFFYECIIKWALLVREINEAFEESQTRPSRLSYINALKVADAL
ncbi:1563_t:CDS:2 [Funneliformis mosseae]|uniref:1563_t:CDS:1 n=1 Tax=Funneliformis mosseae TaxID=27381 RepID=A0A9N9FZV8_FUNMO|nr:1563_t:CDS:2 [Funneliformis mosseae]